MKLSIGCFFLLAVAIGNAATVNVHSGQSIQAAVDGASNGDTVIVHAGDYQESGSTYGVRISKNIHLVGDGNVRLLYSGSQKVGIYAAPTGCEWNHETCNASLLQNVVIENISVEGFEKNGIQTGWIDGFEIKECKSIDNKRHGIYATYSKNGSIKESYSTGSEISAGNTAACESVEVKENQFTGAAAGFEIAKSKNITVKENFIHGNTIGVGMFGAHGARKKQPLFTDFGNCVVQENLILNNNIPNPAPSGHFSSILNPGSGILITGTSGHTIQENIVEDNYSAGIVMLGWCTALALGGVGIQDCNPTADPTADNNLVKENIFGNNGGTALPIPTNGGLVDILYAETVVPPLLDETASNNCFDADSNQVAIFGFRYSSTAVNSITLPCVV